jgi:hypothetical protein
MRSWKPLSGAQRMILRFFLETLMLRKFKVQDRSVVGNCGLHEESNNNNGLRLIGLASALNMVIGSYTFSRKKMHLATWRSLDGTTNNQTDHILTKT